MINVFVDLEIVYLRFVCILWYINLWILWVLFDLIGLDVNLYRRFSDIDFNFIGLYVL